MAKPILINGVSPDHSIYEAKTNPAAAVGTRGFLNDGRVFYYVRHTGSSALARGKLLVRGDVVPNHQNLATDESLVSVGMTTLAAGSVTPGATAITADQYAEGYLVVTDGGGEGTYYKIRSNTAFTSATADGTIDLYDPIAVAFDANTTVSLHTNAYDNPQESVTDQQDVMAGVPVFTIPAGDTTTQYGWVQTWGECPVLCDEAVATFGQALTIGTGVTGAVEEDDTATTVSQEPIVGYNIAALVVDEYQLVNLTIRP